MPLGACCHLQRAEEQRGDIYCRSGQGFGIPNFIFHLTSVGTSFRTTIFERHPRFGAELVMGKGSLWRNIQ